MARHQTWDAVTRQLAVMLQSQYGIRRDVEILHLRGVAEPVVERPERLFISDLLIDLPEQAAPTGTVSSLPHQLQQPRLFGGLVSVLAHHRYSPWRAAISNSATEPDRLDMGAALKLDQIRAQARAAADAPAAQVMMRSYRGDVEVPYTADARELLETALLEGPVRAVGGLAAGTEVEPLMDSLPGLMGDALWERHEKLTQALHEEPGSNPAAMLALGEAWRGIVDEALGAGVSTSGLDSEIARSRRRSANGGARDAEVWRVRFPPPTRRTPSATMATTMEEWANLLDPDGDVTLGRGENPGGDILPTNRRVAYRDATLDERETSHILGRELAKVRYRAPNSTTVATGIPVGRLNTRELVQATAQRTMGIAVTASPWSRPVREPVTQPGLACAIVFDASQSMAPFRAPLASATWAMSHAVATIGGTVTTWGFGGTAFETIRQHTTPTQVPVVVDDGSQSDGCPVALARAAAGARLLEMRGARLAMILTDAALPEKDLEVLDDQFARLSGEGVTCVMVKLGALGRTPDLNHCKIIECVAAADLGDVILGQVVDTLATA